MDACIDVTICVVCKEWTDLIQTFLYNLINFKTTSRYTHNMNNSIII